MCQVTIAVRREVSLFSSHRGQNIALFANTGALHRAEATAAADYPAISARVPAKLNI